MLKENMSPGSFSIIGDICIWINGDVPYVTYTC